MTEVARLSGTVDLQDGFRVVTRSGGTEYEYELRRTEAGSSTLTVTARLADGEDVEPKATETVRDLMEERGFDVE